MVFFFVISCSPGTLRPSTILSEQYECYSDTTGTTECDGSTLEIVSSNYHLSTNQLDLSSPQWDQTCSLIHRVTKTLHLTSPPTCPLTHHPLTHLLMLLYHLLTQYTHCTCSVTTSPLTHVTEHARSLPHCPLNHHVLTSTCIYHYHLLTHPLTHMLGHYQVVHSLTQPPTLQSQITNRAPAKSTMYQSLRHYNTAQQSPSTLNQS